MTRLALAAAILLAVSASPLEDSLRTCRAFFGPMECYAGLCFPVPYLNNFGHSMDYFKQALDYRPRDDDIFIVTYPKCGTTWARQIVTLLLNKGSVGDKDSFKDLENITPFLEFQPRSRLDDLKRPNAIWTHLPFDLIPWNPKAKYIVVTRNPKDQLASYFFYRKNFLPSDPNFKGNLTMDDYLPYHFDKSAHSYGSYFEWHQEADYCLGHSNVKLFVYEEMLTDPKTAVEQFADFLGVDVSDPKFLADTLRKSSASHMKESLDKEYVGVSNNQSFVRKASVGDWRNHLTPEQSHVIDKMAKEKLKDTAFEHLWDNFDVYE
ncbi:Amine sulfotransferase [Halotydeus destructor]|nr:Amine sulfotransferase [Halotydeus destructor]